MIWGRRTKANDSGRALAGLLGIVLLVVAAVGGWLILGGDREVPAGPAEGANRDTLADSPAPSPAPPDETGAATRAAVGRSGGADLAAALSAVQSGESPPVVYSLPPVEPEALEPDIDPIDPSNRVPRPDAVRGIYLTAWTAGSGDRLAELIALADTTEINAFVIDVKDASGRVSYPSSIPFVRTIGADDQVRIANVRAVLAKLRAHGIYSIARIVVFKDPLLANARPDWAIRREDGTLWQDNAEEIWVDPYNENVWAYDIALAREAAALGFSEIQWDYVRFPDAPSELMRQAVFPARGGRTRTQAIHSFVARSADVLGELGVPVTADVFGLTVSARGGMGIGQDWDRLMGVADVLLPMVYPSHFAEGSYGIPRPNAAPYHTVRTAIEAAVARTPTESGAAHIRPWLQDFTLGEPDYGPIYVRAQIEAVYDAGVDSWVLWNAASRYTAAALAPEHGLPPQFPLPIADLMLELPDSIPIPEIELAEPRLLGTPVSQ